MSTNEDLDLRIRDLAADMKLVMRSVVDTQQTVVRIETRLDERSLAFDGRLEAVEERLDRVEVADKRWAAGTGIISTIVLALATKWGLLK